MFSLISNCLEIPFVILQGYCLQLFFGSFLETRMKRKHYTGALTAAIYGAWKVGGSIYIRVGDTGSVLIKLLLSICILAVLGICFYRGFKRITIYLVFAFITVSEISFFLSYMFLQLGGNLFGLWEWCFQTGRITDVNRYVTIVQVTALGLQAVNYALFILVLYLMLKGIAGNYKEKEYTIHRTELLFILAPNLIGLLICILLRTTIEMAENSTPKLLYDRYPLLVLIIPAILVLCLLSILWGVKLFQNMISLSRERSSRAILERQVAGMQEHIEEMDRVYAGIRSMKHDMKNTLSVVMRLATRGLEESGGGPDVESGKCLENKDLQGYLEELNRSMEQFEFRFKTGNSVADTLLNTKYHEITRLIPDLQMEAEELIFPETLSIQSYDLGIILGNALDNACEACRKLKEKDPGAKAFIRLNSFKKGKLLFIKIENSFDGAICLKESGEFPHTDKKDKNAHGIGLINIQNTVEKYEGAVDWKVAGRVFTLSVMIKADRSICTGS